MKKLAILALSGVGKTTLVKYLQKDSRLKVMKIVDIDSFLPKDFDGNKLNSLKGKERAKYWNSAEINAAKAAVRAKVDIIFGLMVDKKIRNFLQGKGFTFVVLSLPEPVHKNRIRKRFEKTGKVVGIEESIKGQRRLQGLGYKLINAERSVGEVANDIVNEIMG